MNAINNYLNKFRTADGKISNNIENITNLISKNSANKIEKTDKKKEESTKKNKFTQKNRASIKSLNYEDVVNCVIDKTECKSDIQTNIDKEKKLTERKIMKNITENMDLNKEYFEENSKKNYSDEKKYENSKNVNIKEESAEKIDSHKKIYKEPFVNKTRYNIRRTLKFKMEDEELKYNQLKNKNRKNENPANIIKNEIDLKKLSKKIYKEKSILEQDANKKKIMDKLYEQEKNNIKLNSNTNSGFEGCESITSKSKIVKKEVNKPKKAKKEVNLIRMEYSKVKEKIKNFMNFEESNNKIKQTQKKHENLSSNEADKRKRKKPGENFVRLDLKGKYKERKLVRRVNQRKRKMNLGKSLRTYNEKRMKNKDQNYLGEGKEGLSDISNSQYSGDNEDNENSVEIDEKKNTKEKKSDEKIYKEYMNKNMNDYNDKIPCFSEGYFLSEIITKEQNNQKQSSENESKNEKKLTEKMKSIMREAHLNNTDIEFEIQLKRKEFEIILQDYDINKINDSDMIIEYEMENNTNQLSAKIKNLLLNKSKKVSKITNQLGAELLNNIDYQNNSIKDSKKGLSDNKIQNLSYYEFETLCFEKILKENFNYSKFKQNQLKSIKSILNKNNTFIVSPPGGGKSLIYQFCSLFLEGLIIIIGPLISSLLDQLINLPKFITGASLTSFTNSKEKSQIIQGIKENKIKILFITPERFAFENLNKIAFSSLIVFDEVTSCCPISHNFRSSYITIKSILNNFNTNTNNDDLKIDNKDQQEIRNIPLKKPNENFNILLLANFSCKSINNSILDFYNFKNCNIIKERCQINKNVKITSSKENQKTKLVSIMKILKSKSFKNIGSIMIYCNTRASADKIKNFLFQNGFKADSLHSGKTELERQKIQSKFNNNEFNIIVMTSNLSNGISKNDIRLKIIYEIPENVEILYQEIGRSGSDNKTSYLHIFCDEDDYFFHRNNIYKDLNDKVQIIKFINYFFSLLEKNNENLNMNLGEKRKHTKAFDKKKNIEEKLNLLEEDDISEISNSPMEINKMNIIDLEKINENLPSKIAFNFDKAAQLSEIRKNVQINLLLEVLVHNENLNKTKEEEINDDIENMMDIEDIIVHNDKTQKNLCAKFICLGPSEINLRFFKIKSKELSEKEKNIERILKFSREYSGGVTKFNILKAMDELNQTYDELLNYLFMLQCRGDLSYEGKEESMFILVERIPNSIRSLIKLLFDKNREFVDLYIKKLNSLYVLIRKFSVNSCEIFTSNIISELSSEIKTIDYFESFDLYVEKFKSNIEKYFEVNNDSSNYFFMMDSLEEFKMILPIVSAEEESEKDEILNDIMLMMEKEIKIKSNISTVEIVQILFGITIDSKMNYYSNAHWGKYKHHDFEFIYSVVDGLIYTLKPKIHEKLTSQPANKKLKMN